MLKSIVYNNFEIKYKVVKKSNVKNLTLRLKYPNLVNVTSPTHVSDSTIHDFVKSKSKWIYDKLKEFESKSVNNPKPSLVTGDKIFFLGRKYDLVVIKDSSFRKTTLNFTNNKFIVNMPKNRTSLEQYDIIKRLLCEFYIKQGQSIILDRMKIYCKQVGVAPKSVTLKRQTSSWGTCSSLGNIYLNYAIMLAPIEVIDYVLVHELCHLVHMNHSKDFWNLVENLYPDYKIMKSWLKTNGNVINNFF